VDLLCFVLAGIAKDLHHACSVLSHFLEELEAGFEVFWSAVCEGDPENHGIFNRLRTTLALVYEKVV
jgi:hypothetical protein